MRTGLFICAALLAAGTGLRGSQEPKKRAEDKPLITVTGCVDGSWLHVSKSDSAGSYSERYKLRGSKQMMKELSSQYNKHLLDVTGGVTDSASTTHRGKTVQVGKKTRIYTGAKDVPQVPSGDDPSIDVVSFRELKDSCK